MESSLSHNTNLDIINSCNNFLVSKHVDNINHSYSIELAITRFKWVNATSSEIQFFSTSCVDFITHYPSCLHSIINTLTKAAKPKATQLNNIYIFNVHFENFKEYRDYTWSLINKYPKGTKFHGKEFQFLSNLTKNLPLLRYASNTITEIYSNSNNNDLKYFTAVLNNGLKLDINYAQCLSNAITSADIWRSGICNIIVDIYNTHSNSHSAILTYLESNYPHYTFPLESQLSYLNMLFSLSNSLPNSRNEIFHIILSKLILMDNETQNMLVDFVNKNIPHTLDILMVLLFQELNYLLTNTSNEIISDLFQFLSQNIYTLSSTRCIQFVYFYISSLKPVYTELLLQTLFSILYDETRIVESRIAATGFIASLICRQGGISYTFIICAFNYLIKFLGRWAKKYNEKMLIPTELLNSVLEASLWIIYFHSHTLFNNNKRNEILEFFSSIVYGSLGRHLSCGKNLIEKARSSIVGFSKPNILIRIFKLLSNLSHENYSSQLRLPFNTFNLYYSGLFLSLNPDPDPSDGDMDKYTLNYNMDQNLDIDEIKLNWDFDMNFESNTSRKKSDTNLMLSKDVDMLEDFQLIRAGLNTNILEPQFKSQLDCLLISDAYKYSKHSVR